MFNTWLFETWNFWQNRDVERTKHIILNFVLACLKSKLDLRNVQVKAQQRIVKGKGGNRIRGELAATVNSSSEAIISLNFLLQVENHYHGASFFSLDESFHLRPVCDSPYLVMGWILNIDHLNGSSFQMLPVILVYIVFISVHFGLYRFISTYFGPFRSI